MTAAKLSRSPYIFAASLVLGSSWALTLGLWYASRGTAQWGYAGIDLAVLIYLFYQYTQKRPQHRTFHWLLLLSQLMTIGLSAYQVAFHRFFGAPTDLVIWWYNAIDNGLFVLELSIVFVYALLFRRAKKDPPKWNKDTESWLERLRKK